MAGLSEPAIVPVDSEAAATALGLV